MKNSDFLKILFVGNRIFFVSLVCLLLILSFNVNGYAQQEVKVIRHTNSWAPDIDPAIGSNFLNAAVYCNIYDTLVFPNPDGTVEPLLAKSWETSEDGLTYTFNLVSGVKFHNGDELTADDVVFSLERIMTIGQGFGHLFQKSVKEGKALDKYKVQFTLKQSFAPFLNILARLYILNKNQVLANIDKTQNLYGELGDYGRSWLVTNDAGSGPYKSKEIKIAEYILMEKFDDYWRGWENKEDAPQYVKEIGTTEPITVRTLMGRGELEISDMWQTNENYISILQLPNTEMVNLFEGKVLNLTLNTKIPPTDDIHFRKALAYCVDYEQAMEMIFTDSRPSTVVAPSTPGYNPNLEPWKMDMEKAEEEIKKSPYYGKLDQYPFELCWLSTIADEEKLALMIQANAARIGIKVDIVKIPVAAIFERVSKLETTPNGAFFFVANDYPEAGGMLEARYHSSSTGTWMQGEWLLDPEIDAMIEDALTTLDREERFQKYYAIQEEIYERCVSIIIAESPTKQVCRSDYVFWPAAEAVKQGGVCTPIAGYNFYYRDYKVFPEKAEEPYISFEP